MNLNIVFAVVSKGTQSTHAPKVIFAAPKGTFGCLKTFSKIARPNHITEIAGFPLTGNLLLKTSSNLLMA